MSDNGLATPEPFRFDVKRRADRILGSLNARFAAAYSATGRPSVPPERLLKAMLLMALYSVRSERQLCEQIDLNLLFRWFLDMQPSEDAFDASTFSKNRRRLETHGLMQAFFEAVVAEALAKHLWSEHFSVDGTLIESFASAKSSQPKPEQDDRPQDDRPQDEQPKKEQPRNEKSVQKRSTSQPQSDGNDFKPSTTASSGPTRRMRARPIPRPGSTAKGAGKKPSARTWGTR